VSVPNFAQANQGLAAMQQQQSGLRAAVEAGKLWMEPDVAERAAGRCEQQITEVRSIIDDLRELERERKFGDNADGARSRGRSRTLRSPDRTASRVYWRTP